MPTQSITINHYTCTRCAYEWQGRLSVKPKRCPNLKCGSPYWDRPYTRGAPKPREAPPEPKQGSSLPPENTIG